MTLLKGEILWNLIWILPLLSFLFYFGYRKRNLLLERFLGKHAGNPARINSSSGLRFWRGILFSAVLILLVVAAARPSWGIRILPYSGQGRDLMVVFDVSKSMLSQDVRPSRLEHAKWLLRQLCTRNPGDRFGLIAFAGHAFMECPLTIDRTSFLQSADELSVDSIPVGGTNIQQALTEAIRDFRAAETPHRAVILITDGDELTGDSTKALHEIVKLKIPLFIFGIGDPSQPAIVQVPDGKGGIQTLKDSSGNVVSVPLNEKMLAGLARQTGGIYVRSTTTHPGLDQIEARIKKLEKHDIDSGKQTRPIERPLYPLLAAFILFGLWLILGECKSGTGRRTMTILLACGLTGLMFASSAREPSETQSPKDIPAPASETKKDVKTEPLSPEELYNLGLKAQTQEKNTEKAIQLYEQAIAAVHSAPAVRSRSAQNLGVIHHQMARAMFQNALQTLRKQQLDQALQQAENVLKQLVSTEDIYRNALRENAGPDQSPARNQYQLLLDRKKAEELKKKIEDLKKKQQEARQNTQQALNQQQKQNQKQNQKQDQPKQDQQQNQNQKQDQPKQDQQQDQQQNQRQTEKARESVRQMEQQAEKLNQKNLKEQAKKAGEELDKAHQAQKQNNSKDAEKHLKNALDQLGKDQPKQDQKQNKDQPKQNQPKRDQQQNQKQDRPLPKPGERNPQQEPKPEKEIDKDQAKALLDLMAGDEKKLKDELKKRMKHNYGTRPADKDW